MSSSSSMRRVKWCAEVAVLCAPGMHAEAQAALSLMLPALQHLPDELFTTETARAVAMAERRLATPAWDEIMRALNAYRSSYGASPRPAGVRPAAPALPAPEPAPPSSADRDAVLRKFDRLKADLARKLSPHDPRHDPPSTPLPDVSLSGEALRRSREARGCVVVPSAPQQEEAPG